MVVVVRPSAARAVKVVRLVGRGQRLGNLDRNVFFLVAHWSHCAKRPSRQRDLGRTQFWGWTPRECGPQLALGQMGFGYRGIRERNDDLRSAGRRGALFFSATAVVRLESGFSFVSSGETFIVNFDE